MADENRNAFSITVNTEYTERVVVEILIENGYIDQLCKEIVEATSGKAGIEKIEECYCAVADGEVIVF